MVNRNLICICVLISLASCQDANKSESGIIEASSEGSQISAIETEIRSNPKISSEGLNIAVVKLENGYLTLAVNGLDARATNAINRGRDMKTVYMTESMKVAPLIEMEEILQKNHGIKAIVWSVPN